MNTYLVSGHRGPYLLWRVNLNAHSEEEAVAIGGHDFERINVEYISCVRVLAIGELLPCPFCGSAATVKSDQRSSCFCDWVECTNWNCGARTASDDSFVGAVKAWNCRAFSDIGELLPYNDSRKATSATLPPQLPD
ncbi:MAG: Lar family restriction alleviation protein [Ktedonobacteraceae bacterium]|nr:Lar family restriction alleviation protein [Ktedonobacteraceae bacterium]